jgi:hypothetical protein
MMVVMVPGASDGVAVTEGVAVIVTPEETVTELLPVASTPVDWAPEDWAPVD